MGESNRRKRRRSKPIREENFPISKFGRCVEVCADGVKPGQWLAARIGCSERNANLIIAGRQKPNARAVLAVNAAWLEDGARRQA